MSVDSYRETGTLPLERAKDHRRAVSLNQTAPDTPSSHHLQQGSGIFPNVSGVGSDVGDSQKLCEVAEDLSFVGDPVLSYRSRLRQTDRSHRSAQRESESQEQNIFCHQRLAGIRTKRSGRSL